MILFTHFLNDTASSKDIFFYSEKSNLLCADFTKTKLHEHQKSLLKPIEQLTENINLYDTGYISKTVNFTLDAIRNLVGEKSFSISPSKNNNYVLIYNPVAVGEINLFATSLLNQEGVVVRGNASYMSLDRFRKLT